MVFYSVKGNNADERLVLHSHMSCWVSKKFLKLDCVPSDQILSMHFQVSGWGRGMITSIYSSEEIDEEHLQRAASESWNYTFTAGHQRVRQHRFSLVNMWKLSLRGRESGKNGAICRFGCILKDSRIFKSDPIKAISKFVTKTHVIKKEQRANR